MIINKIKHKKLGKSIYYSYIVLNTYSNQKTSMASIKVYMKNEDTEVRIKHVGEELLITFLEDVRAVTPGQACVIYQGDRCLGGGFIKEVYKNKEIRKY